MFLWQVFSHIESIRQVISPFLHILRFWTIQILDQNIDQAGIALNRYDVAGHISSVAFVKFIFSRMKAIISAINRDIGHLSCVVFLPHTR